MSFTIPFSDLALRIADEDMGIFSSGIAEFYDSGDLAKLTLSGLAKTDPITIIQRNESNQFMRLLFLSFNRSLRRHKGAAIAEAMAKARPNNDLGRAVPYSLGN